MPKAKPTETAGGAKPPRKRRGRRAAESPALQPRSDDANAFIPDPEGGPARTGDDLAELLAEDFVESATRGNEVLEDDLDQPLSDEIGGPFVLTRAREEFAEGTDESNPADAEPAPLPKPVAGLVQRPRAEELDADEDEDEDERAERASDEDEEEDEGVTSVQTGEAGEELAESEDENDDEDADEDEDEDEVAEKEEDDDTDEIEALGDEEDADELDDGTRRRTR